MAQREPTSAIAPGFQVTPSVRLVRQIGEGGMGSVWLADHLTLDTQVAVKFMSPALASNAAAVERFIREAKSSARIRHPNVVATLDSGVSAGAHQLPYIVMEYLEGDDLETRIQSRGRLSLDDVARIVLQTSRALEKAHELGVVHRDIKPENIFLCGRGEDLYVKVLDFGIAKHETEKGEIRVTNTGATLGTPSYMSPEQMVSARSVDFRCDLWALAVVAYHALTGQLPFPGETYGAICLAVNRAKFRLPSRMRRQLPSALDEWFTRAFAREAKHRFRSARELGDTFVVAATGASASSWRTVTPFTELRGTLGGAAVTENPDEPHRSGSRWVPLVAVLALTAGASLAVLVGRPWLGHAGWTIPTLTAATTSVGASAHPMPPAPLAAATSTVPAPPALTEASGAEHLARDVATAQVTEASVSAVVPHAAAAATSGMTGKATTPAGAATKGSGDKIAGRMHRRNVAGVTIPASQPALSESQPATEGTDSAVPADPVVVPADPSLSASPPSES